MKNCKCCGKDFEPKNPKGVFCSANCRVKWNQRQKRLLKYAKNPKTTGTTPIDTTTKRDYMAEMAEKLKQLQNERNGN